MTWPTKKLGDVTKIEGGGTPSTKNPLFWNGDVSWLTPKELSDFSDREIFDTERKITSEGLRHSKLFPAGTVLFTSRAPIGYVAIAGIQMATNQGFKNFICSEKVLNNGFLYYFIKLKTKYLQSLGRGATFTEISRSILAKVDIPLPPIATQKQIVELLDKIDEAQKLNDELIQKTDELFQSLLHKELNPAGLTYAPTKQNTNKLEYVGMSGSHSKTPADASAFVKTSADKRAMAGKKDWEIKKLGECMIQFDRGISWSRKDEGGAIAVLRIPNIEEGHINLNDLKHIDPKNGNGELDKNDIVMVASNGNPDLVGRSALVAEKEKGMRFASFLVRLRLDDTKLLSHYAHLFLLTPTFKRELRRKIATTSGIYNLRKEHVEKIKISLPPLETQKQIVAKLSAVQDYKKQLLGQKAKLKELFDSALHKSMTQRPH